MGRIGRFGSLESEEVQKFKSSTFNCGIFGHERARMGMFWHEWARMGTNGNDRARLGTFGYGLGNYLRRDYGGTMRRLGVIP